MSSLRRTLSLVALCLAPLAAAAAPVAPPPVAPAATPATAPPRRVEAPRKAKRLKVAVMEVRVLYGDPQAEALLSEVALTEAAAFKGFDTIGRSDIQSMLGLERQRQLLGCTEDASCLAELGGALGVDYLLVGSVGRLGNLLRLDLKLVDGRRARVLGRVGTSLDDKVEKLIEATQAGVRALLRELSPEEALPPPVSRTGPSRTPAWIALSIGAAALAAGATSAALASSEYSSLKAAQATPGYAASYDSRSQKVRRYALLADVLVPVGVASLGVGGWLWWRSRPAAAVKVQLTATPGGGGVLLSGGF